MGSATEVTSSGLGQLSLGGQVAGKGTGNYLGRAGSPLGRVGRLGALRPGLLRLNFGLSAG